MSLFSAGGCSLAPSKRKGKSAGFTLVEVLLALAIMAIVFVAVLQANLRVQDSILASREQAAATFLATELLIRAESEGPGSLSSYRGTETRDGRSLAWQIAVDRTSFEGMHKVLVQVREPERGRILAEREAILQETKVNND